MNISKVKKIILTLGICSLLLSCSKATAKTEISTETKNSSAYSYPVVDTGQEKLFNNTKEVSKIKKGKHFYGQDANYSGYQPGYNDNGDGTVTDLVTGLMWIQNPGEKVNFETAVYNAKQITVGGYSDWRLPTIKELYSLIDFSGQDISGARNFDDVKPFINTKYFKFEYGDISKGERAIDSQYWSSTEYVSTTMNGNETVFGVNFADGRIKGYPKRAAGRDKLNYVLYVRGNSEYGKNNFADNGDGTISDNATGLMWSQTDSGKGMTWEEALKWAENSEYAGYRDWRLPNAKELQSIVDYSRSPATTDSAAIDEIFESSEIKDEGGNKNYPFYWTGTTHESLNRKPGRNAVYIAFGEALGFFGGKNESLGMPSGEGMGRPPRRDERNDNKRPDNRMLQNQNNSKKELMDVHGAGAQRSDPKSGDTSKYPQGHGPQGDVIRINNYVRLVRNID